MVIRATIAFLVTSAAAFADDQSPLPDPAEDVVAFAKSEVRYPNAEVRQELVTVEKFCAGVCGEIRVSVVLIEGSNGKSGDTARNYLVTLTYLSTKANSGGMLGEYRALPLLVSRTTVHGRPKFELSAVLPFGSLESKLRP